MTPDPTDFSFHKLVVGHEILVEGDIPGAINYVDGVRAALASELAHNAALTEAIDDLECFLAILRGASELSEADSVRLTEYVGRFKKC